MRTSALSLMMISLLGVLLTLLDLTVGNHLYDSAFYRAFVTLAGIAFNVALIVFVLIVVRHVRALEQLGKAAPPPPEG